MGDVHLEDIKEKNIKYLIAFLVLFVLFVPIIPNKYIVGGPVEYHKVFKNAFVTTDRINSSAPVDLEIDGTLYTGELIKGSTKRKDLIGTIKIGDKKYNFKGYNLGEYTNNVLWGEVTEASTDSKPEFTIFMFDDLSSIYLSGDNQEKI
ncbi:hypothetical protein [Inconstantimicrobium mannanitabidum]|uniref:Uncharacterized protein n=1 Tax=Inconstantimicrobium mannanitabidum TaxID=1604901 RepID=A0ACB5RBX7_9CLOT|nr:hypothetical protein [Clostridium sp. TW13]GKX66749.1 hypothetical protein rsdtw13_20070 [Clostridium sp. TW13]